MASTSKHPANRGRARYTIARDEEETILEAKRVRNMNRKARSEIGKVAKARPVWKPGDPPPTRST